MLNRSSMLRFLDEKLRTLGTSACPPYHLAVVIGGTSAEFALKTAKYASAHYLDSLPTTGSELGHGFRDLELEAGRPRPHAGLRHRRPVRRQVLLPRRARHPAPAPRRLVPDRRGRVVLGRPSGARQDHPRRRVPRAARGGPGALPARGHPRRPRRDDVVRIDLNRPMDEIRSELSRYPVKTRLSLSGPMVVARDIAHAKIKERLDAGEPMPQYLRDHCVYYAGPAKTPEGHGLGLVRADHRRPHGLLRRGVPGRRRLAGDAGQGQPQPPGHRRLRRPTAASTSGRSAGPPPAWPRTASARSRCWSTPSWAWRRSGGSRWRTSPPSSSWTTRATTSSTS